MIASMNRLKTYANDLRKAGKNNQIKKIRLKTCFKNRASHKQIQQQQSMRNSFNDQKIFDRNASNKQLVKSHKFSRSLDIQKLNQQQEKQKLGKIFNQNTIKKLQSISISVPAQQNTYQKLMHKLNILDLQAESLIKRKISNINKLQDSPTLKNKFKDQLTNQLQTLINKIKNIHHDRLQGPTLSQIQIHTFTARKIKLLQKLIAEKLVQSEILKNHYFAMNTKNKASRSPTRLLTKSLNRGQISYNKLNYGYRSKEQQIQDPNVCNQSSNKLQFLTPKASEYQSYRHRPKDYVANLQPFPRSSYNRQFLINPKIVNFSCKMTEDHTGFGRRKFISSTYSKDFQRVRTQIVDYKQLDSYRNKIKSIPVSYALHNRKQQQQEYIQKNRKYIQQQIKMRHNREHLTKIHAQSSRVKQIDESNVSLKPKVSLDSFLFTSQNKTRYKGQQSIDHSQIKNKQLNNLKYNYKLLIYN